MYFVQQVFADSLSGAIPDPLGGRIDSLSNVFGIVFNVVVFVGFAMGIVSIALGFVNMVLSEGDKNKLITTKAYLTYGTYAVIIAMFMGSMKFILTYGFTGTDWNIQDITDFVTPGTPRSGGGTGSGGGSGGGTPPPRPGPGGNPGPVPVEGISCTAPMVACGDGSLTNSVCCGPSQTCNVGTPSTCSCGAGTVACVGSTYTVCCPSANDCLISIDTGIPRCSDGTVPL